MSKNSLEKIFRQQFKYLESEYNFRMEKLSEENWGLQLLYINDTTAVKISFVYREAYIFITLYRLENFKFIENPKFINLDTKLYGFSLDDIILLRNPKALVKPAYNYPEDSKYFRKKSGLSLYIRKFSKNLRMYAEDVLKGDFSLFTKLDKVVKNRLKNVN